MGRVVPGGYVLLVPSGWREGSFVITVSSRVAVLRDVPAVGTCLWCDLKWFEMGRGWALGCGARVRSEPTTKTGCVLGGIRNAVLFRGAEEESGAVLAVFSAQLNERGSVRERARGARAVELHVVKAQLKHQLQVTT